MSKLAKALTAAAGNAAGESLYVEDVFSTYLYEGTGAAHTITNGIDLSGEGGLVWIKTRNTGTSAWHSLSDTERGAGYILRSDLTNAQNFDAAEFTSFNSNGFTVGNDTQTNGSGRTYASWTFRKAEKFFDVVTWTGNGVAGREISHNLGSVPGMIIVKVLDYTGVESRTSWNVYHKSTPTGFLNLNLTSSLNTTDMKSKFGDNINAVAPTDSVFTVGADYSVNHANGYTYVAYLFASDAGGFGDDGTENIIKCGSYTGTGSIGLQVDLGFEPQWVLLKAASRSSPWALVDNMRGFLGQNTQVLQANSSSDEFTTGLYNTGSIQCNATGFSVETNDNSSNGSGDTYIYIAIRRPMKTPESGTEVFALQDPGYPVDSNGLAFTSNFPVDLALLKERTNSTDGWYTMSRMQGSGNFMKTNSTAAESSGVTYGTFDHNTGWYSTASASMSWMFKRATGFFDVVAYTGNGVAGRTVAHNLGVAPELVIIKQRNASGEDWKVGVNFTATNNQERALNQPDSLVTLDYTSYGVFNGQPTAANITLNSSTAVNASSSTYIAYLFATLAGVSKVGSYTGTGSNVDVDCGFSAGARFILIKRTDSTGDWYVYDSVRGIVAGNDPYLLLNSTAGEVTNTDYIDPLASGFTVTSSAPAALNASGGTYIFLAIA